MTAKHIGVNVSDLIEQHSIKFQGYRCDKIYRAKLVHAKRICIILLDCIHNKDFVSDLLGLSYGKIWHVHKKHEATENIRDNHFINGTIKYIKPKK